MTGIMLGAAASFLAAIACAQDAPAAVVLAGFADGGAALAERIPFPASPAGDFLVRVYCDVAVDRYGELGRHYCFTDGEAHEDLAALVEDSLVDPLRIRPASVDGWAVEVTLQYTLVFARRGGAETIHAYPHHFIGVDGGGEDYVAPQRYLDPAMRGTVLGRCTAKYRMWFTMRIPATGGYPEDVRVEGEGHDRNCLRMLTRRIGQGRYLPGLHKGEAAALPLREVWFTADSLTRGRPLPNVALPR